MAPHCPRNGRLQRIQDFFHYRQLEADRVGSLCLTREEYKSWIQPGNLRKPCRRLNLSHWTHCHQYGHFRPLISINLVSYKLKGTAKPDKDRHNCEPPWATSLLFFQEGKGNVELLMFWWKTERRNQFCSSVTWQLTTETGMTPLPSHFLVPYKPWHDIAFQFANSPLPSLDTQQVKSKNKHAYGARKVGETQEKVASSVFFLLRIWGLRVTAHLQV